MDEGHRLKGRQSRLAGELAAMPAAARLLLTGTPLQNNLGELFQLLTFLEPGKFNSLEEFQVRAAAARWHCACVPGKP